MVVSVRQILHKNPRCRTSSLGGKSSWIAAAGSQRSMGGGQFAGSMSLPSTRISKWSIIAVSRAIAFASAGSMIVHDLLKFQEREPSALTYRSERRTVTKWSARRRLDLLNIRAEIGKQRAHSLVAAELPISTTRRSDNTPITAAFPHWRFCDHPCRLCPDQDRPGGSTPDAQALVSHIDMSQEDRDRRLRSSFAGSRV